MCRLLRILNNLPHAIRQVLDEGLMALEGLRQMSVVNLSILLLTCFLVVGQKVHTNLAPQLSGGPHFRFVRA